MLAVSAEANQPSRAFGRPILEHFDQIYFKATVTKCHKVLQSVAENVRRKSTINVTCHANAESLS